MPQQFPPAALSNIYGKVHLAIIALHDDLGGYRNVDPSSSIRSLHDLVPNWQSGPLESALFQQLAQLRGQSWSLVTATQSLSPDAMASIGRDRFAYGLANDVESVTPRVSLPYLDIKRLEAAYLPPMLGLIRHTRRQVESQLR